MFTSLALAQLPTATILGVVKDSSGAVVPDAALTARSLETGQTRTATSAADGSYRLPALPVGAYEIRAEHAGFQTEVRTGLTLTISQEAVVNFSLQVGAVTETVSVTAEAPLVNTTSGSLGGLVSEQKVADLPLNGRNYMDLTLLQPGITQHRNF
ncbi:MAG TPA: carboxypeptidase-like regulatory domain-containing protein, partial [Candidatus Glassbacteria bacterium]|nr:carboxypeptidase-like regulatory domain-containing protein [Candidatus Glassbacteria bacterium]